MGARKIFRSVGRERWLIADQLLVSALNFFTGILLVRFMGLQQYGVFVLLYAALIYVNTVQANLILAPMMSLAPQCASKEERTRFLDGIFTLQVGLAVVFAIGLAVFGSIVSRIRPAWGVGVNMPALVVAAVSFQIQDWLRRYFFVLDRAFAAFWNDLISYLGQVIAFVAIARVSHLTPASALFAIGITSAVAFIAGLPVARIRIDVGSAVTATARIWRVSRDLFLAGQMQWVGSQGVLLIAAAILGTVAAGGIRAAQNIAGPINVMFQALENIMPLRAAQRYAANGYSALVRFMRKTTVIGTVGLASVFVVIAVISPWLLAITYGASARKYAAVVVWQLIYFLFGFIWRQLIYFYRTLGTTTSVVWSNALACVASVAATPLAIRLFHEAGVLVAITVGEIACIVLLTIGLRSRALRSMEREAEVCAV